MKNKAHLVATLQALLVTFIWSTSLILIKLYITEIPPLLFAGLRYSIAVILLTPALWRYRADIKALSKRDWLMLFLLGVFYYAITQGAQFISLQHVDMVTISLILTFTAPLVAIVGIFFLREPVLPQQWMGTFIFIVGVLIYFSQKTLSSLSLFGIAMVLLSLISNVTGTVLGRYANRGQKHNALVVTGISMFFGAILLLGTGLSLHGMPRFDLKSWLLIIYLASIGTAFAFWLWNHSMRTLSAMESSVINNTMLIQISVLSWVFLNERITLIEGIGLVVAMIGVFLVSVRLKKQPKVNASTQGTSSEA